LCKEDARNGYKSMPWLNEEILRYGSEQLQNATAYRMQNYNKCKKQEEQASSQANKEARHEIPSRSDVVALVQSRIRFSNQNQIGEKET